MARSPALRWRVTHPAGDVGLSDFERDLYDYLHVTRKATGGIFRLRSYARSRRVAPSSVSEGLAVLRILGLVAYKSHRGIAGYVWYRFGGRPGVASRGFRRRIARRAPAFRCYGNVRTRPNGQTSSAAALAHESGAPPGAGVRRAGTGPRRGRRPPRYLFGRCPAGHPVKSGRWVGRDAADGWLSAEYRGVCRHCGSAVSELLVLELRTARPAAVERRPLSPAELASPVIRAARERRAAELAASGLLDRHAAAALRRDYGPPDE